MGAQMREAWREEPLVCCIDPPHQKLTDIRPEQNSFAGILRSIEDRFQKISTAIPCFHHRSCSGIYGKDAI